MGFPGSCIFNFLQDMQRAFNSVDSYFLIFSPSQAVENVSSGLPRCSSSPVQTVQTIQHGCRVKSWQNLTSFSSTAARTGISRRRSHFCFKTTCALDVITTTYPGYVTQKTPTRQLKRVLRDSMLNCVRHAIKIRLGSHTNKILQRNNKDEFSGFIPEVQSSYERQVLQ